MFDYDSSEEDEEVTVTNIHSLGLEEGDDTTLADKEGYTSEESEPDEDSCYRRYGLYEGRRRGHRHSETDDYRHSDPFPRIAPRTGPHSPSSLLRDDLPVMSSSATRASATVALPRTIEDVHSDINREIGKVRGGKDRGIL